MYPIIKKAKAITGSNLVLRDIRVDDAEFILNLRLDPLKNRYLSATSNKLEDQIEWIRSYQTNTDQAYFVICDKHERRLGCIRMYDQIENSYCWGSWLMINGLPPMASIESALLIYAYGRHLGFEEARIDVYIENKDVCNFHENFFSAELVDETDVQKFYVIRKQTIERLLLKYARLLGNPLKIEPCQCNPAIRSEP